MPLHPLAGKPAPADMLVDPRRLERAYYEDRPEPGVADQAVAFGTSGHRGSPLKRSFNEAHILAVTQAICEWRRAHGIDGPFYLGKDTHAVSAPAERTALEVLAAHGVQVFLQHDNGYTPTPAISRAILAHNRGGGKGQADGIVVTPSHNPPEDGGFKYNPPDGGPADTDITGWVQDRANALLAENLRSVRRLPYEAACRAPGIKADDFIGPYVRDLRNVLDMDAIRTAGVRVGVDPLGGAAVAYWDAVRDEYDIDLTVVNPRVDPTFSFMTLDHDGVIRIDCSSPHAMAGLVSLKDRYDIAFGNDTDADRHGIVTKTAGLMNPNRFLSVAIDYLLVRRPQWPRSAMVGKTLVSSALIDRVVAGLGRRLLEVPVGFKWFVKGLYDGGCCFGGEESAGASFLRRDGTVWTTDKDGLLLGLLAAEITATTGRDPSEHERILLARYGTPHYTRIDAKATPAQKAVLKNLAAGDLKATTLAGDPIAARLTRAPGNDAPIGGLKVTTANGWFAARPSGTENVYKLYAESFRGRGHLDLIVEEAQAIVARALAKEA